MSTVAASRESPPRSVGILARAPALSHSLSEPTTPPPPLHPRYTRDLRNWAARRQADLVLYLGAFLLSVSALIFVSYQGSGMSGIGKSAVFGAYTVMFLVLGMQLGKCKRVQEAGPVFLAIGAIMAPLNFVALYTNVLQNDDVAQQFVWLAGSSGTAALYFLLASRGSPVLTGSPAECPRSRPTPHSRLPRAPRGRYGPWFLGLAVAVKAFAQRQPVALSAATSSWAFALG